MWRALAVVLAIGMAGCLSSQLVPCGDRLCPAQDTCIANQRCASPDQLAACAGLADGTTCTVNGGVGQCDRGGCVLAGCGNCVVDLGEDCDDCNQIVGDGCSNECRSEECGNGIVDVGEGCDDGNANPADGCDACKLTMWNASAVIGGAATTTATSIGLQSPAGLAVDLAGNVYIADTANHRIRRIDPSGAVATVAGTGASGFSGDGGRATEALLNLPSSVAVDGLGNVYIADTANQRIRKVDAAGTITTIAGTGIAGYSGDASPAGAAQLRDPSGVSVDGLGNIYIADTHNHRIRRVDPNGIIVTIAGNGSAGFSGDGVATAVKLNSPTGVLIDQLVNLYVADTQNHRVRLVDLKNGGILTTIAGNGFTNGGGDGGPATNASLAFPQSIALAGGNVLYIADTSHNQIRRVVSGTITTDAGKGTYGFEGDGGNAALAEIAHPEAVAVDALGNVYVADTNNQRIRRIDTTKTITTIAGNNGSQDGRAATSVTLQPWGIALDGVGNLYIADTYNHRIRRVDANGVMTTVAGNGSPGYTGDSGSAVNARLNLPFAVTLDAQGNVLIADTTNRCVRRVDTSGTITTVASDSVRFDSLTGVAVTSTGTIYVSDNEAPRILRIDAAGTVTPFAGSGTSGYNGDGIPASNADIAYPWGVAVDTQNNIYVADSSNQRIRKIDATTQYIATVAGDGTTGGGGDGLAATAAQLNAPDGMSLDAAGNMYIADSGNGRVRRVDATTQTITTVAGTGPASFSGDGGSALNAGLPDPHSVAVHGGGVYVVDPTMGFVRKISGGTITTVAGKVAPEGVGPLAEAQLADPRALAVGGASRVFIAGGTSGTVELARFDTAWLDVVAGRYPQVLATGNLARYRNFSFGDVRGLAYDEAAGRLYLSESSQNRIDVVTITNPDDPRTWTIATLAGIGSSPGHVNGPIAQARFRSPAGLYLDAAAQLLYVADSGNHVVRTIDLATNMVDTVAGTPQTRGYFGDGGAATSALLHDPRAIAKCSNGDLFVADTGNNRVRRIATNGTITTVLGNGIVGASGEGTPATMVPLEAPGGLACDDHGNVFVTSTKTVRLLTANEQGVVDGSGAASTIYGAATTFPASVTRCLTGLAVVDATTVEVTDSCTGLLVALHRELQ